MSNPDKPGSSELHDQESDQETEVTDDTLRLYLLGDLSDEDRIKFESNVESNPNLSARLQKMQEQFETDWYAKKFTETEERKLWTLYVTTPRHQLKLKHSQYIKGFLVQVYGSGDTSIMPSFWNKRHGFKP